MFERGPCLVGHGQFTVTLSYKLYSFRITVGDTFYRTLMILGTVYLLLSWDYISCLLAIWHGLGVCDARLVKASCFKYRHLRINKRYTVERGKMLREFSRIVKEGFDSLASTYGLFTFHYFLAKVFIKSFSII